MKNKEKYAKEIMEIACSGNRLAVSKVTGKPIECENIGCKECVRYKDSTAECSRECLTEWAESEYIKPVISKSDRAFLEYLDKKFKYIARDKNDELMAYQHNVKKLEDKWTYKYNTGMLKSLCGLNIDFPMVKWVDDEPWFVGDLKRLEVVESYE